MRSMINRSNKTDDHCRRGERFLMKSCVFWLFQLKNYRPTNGRIHRRTDRRTLSLIELTRPDTQTGIRRVWLGRGSNVVGSGECFKHDNISHWPLGRSSDAKTARKMPKKQRQDRQTDRQIDRHSDL